MEFCKYILFLLLCCPVPELFAHDTDNHHGTGPASVRHWTLASGVTVFRGVLESYRHQYARIRLNTGRLIRIAHHQLSQKDQAWIAERQAYLRHLNGLSAKLFYTPFEQVLSEARWDGPKLTQHFKPFSKQLRFRWDNHYFYVESNGLPSHAMMVGIRSWQQQIPIPQAYVGENAWMIPLHPTAAPNPISTRNQFLRGAIALAVNGVPIFNPLNNRGDDAYLAGELDEYGGHCGKADDYHYHLPPIHLQTSIQPGDPIAYALDGYPILGLQTREESEASPLDWMNGHKDQKGNYHYHATLRYPYLNGGFYGRVNHRGDQVSPQPRSQPLRPAGEPLSGATITHFNRSTDGKRVSLRYKRNGETGTMQYETDDFNTYLFRYDTGNRQRRTETYRLRPTKR